MARRQDQPDPPWAARRPEGEAQRRAAIAALKLSEERLLLALDAGGAGAWDIDLESGDVSLSDKILARFGCTDKETVRILADVLRHIHPADHRIVRVAMSARLRGESEAYRCD